LLAFLAEIEIRWLRKTGPLRAFWYGGCCQLLSVIVGGGSNSHLRMSTVEYQLIY
jgi:hypothetical protein